MASLLIFLGLLALDQGSKAWVIARLPVGETVQVIPHFFYLTHWQNKGAAFGFLAQHRHGASILLGLSCSLCLGLAFLLSKAVYWRFKLPLLLILAGAVGNIVDRLRLKAVTDFLHFQFGTYHYPIFNLADMSIVLGCFGLIFLLLFHQESQQLLETLDFHHETRGH